MVEDLSEVFKPEAKTIIKVFGDADSYYQIPDYQRPFSWIDDQIEQLWDDIFSAMQSNDESYFLGPMILIKTKKDYFEVVDGQQRLTTLTILFCVLRDFYLKNDKRILNSIESLVDQKYRLRLITQLHHQDKFVNEILDGVKLPERELTKREREKEKFINAALIFKNKLDELDSKQISNLVDFLLNKVVMITITCSKQSFAIKLFQILNTRGLNLSNTDLIKSYLYGRLVEETKSDEKKLQQFNFTWNELETISKQIEEEIEDLFTLYEYYILARNPKYSLYDELTNNTGFKSGDPNKVIYEVKRFIEYFSKISKIETKLIFSFWYLPNQFFWKSILTTAMMSDFKNIDGLCKELRRFYYSYWVAGYTTSKIKQMSFNIIGWIKEKKNLDYIKNEIEKKISEDNVIKWIKENLQNDAYDTSWLKPLLALIEYEQTDDSKITFIELDKRIHVDHILPEKWYQIDYWKKRWNEEEAKAVLHKIGNLTLLSGKKNIAASNDSFTKKKEIYKGKGVDGTTAFEITKKIIDEDDWLEQNVRNRQTWAIKEIEKILNIKIK